jgi:hypothetical protein
MWANILKNFVHGPSAAVTFSRRPYPGALSQTANSKQQTANSKQQPDTNLTKTYNVVL